MPNNLFFYQCNYDSDNDKYEVNKIGRVYSLVDMIEYFYMTDLDENMYAIFKDDIKPRHEYRQNRFKLTIRIDENVDVIEFLENLWEDNAFDKKEVNGIYITNKKMSIWLRKQCYIGALKPYKFTFVKIKHDPDKADLSRFWTIGLFSGDSFKHMEKENYCDKFIKTNSAEFLARNIERFYHLKEDGNGVFLASNILSEDEWRMRHRDNRFVFSQVEVDLQTAKKIWLRFALNLACTIFPLFSNVYVGFCFYQDGNLEVGLYLTGDERFSTCYEADEGAINVAHKLKEILLNYCNLEDMNADLVSITNAVPSIDADFLNPIYEYRTDIRI